MKNRVLYSFFFLIIFIIFLNPLYAKFLFISHDGDSQIARIAATYKALVDGQFPPRWAADLNYGYGNPVLIYSYPLPSYLGSFLHAAGFSFLNAYKLLIASGFMFSIIFFYIWMQSLFKNDAIAFVSALFYGLSPYMLLDMYVRGHVGEVLGLSLIPLIFYSIDKNNEKPSYKNIVTGALSYSFFILSHNSLSLIFTPIIIGYFVLTSWRNKKNVLVNFIMMIFGLGLSAFFWFPALIEGRYINSKFFLDSWFADHFIKYENLIYSRWGFGSDINSHGGLAAYIGPIHFFMVFLAIFYYKKIKKNRIVLFWLVSLLIGISLSTNISYNIWNNIHIFQQIQFPWKFIVLAMFASSIIIGHVLTLFKKKFLILLTIAIVLISIPLVRVKSYTNKDDEYYLNFRGASVYHGEASTIWVAGESSKFAKNKIEIIEGNGKLHTQIRRSNLHVFLVESDSSVRVLDNTVYFPGWKVYIDDVKSIIEFQDIQYRGLITFRVPEGKHTLMVRFDESPIRRISDCMSLLFFGSFILAFCFRKRINLLLHS